MALVRVCSLHTCTWIGTQRIKSGSKSPYFNWLVEVLTSSRLHRRLPLTCRTIHFPSKQPRLMGRGKGKEPQLPQRTGPLFTLHCEARWHRHPNTMGDNPYTQPQSQSLLSKWFVCMHTREEKSGVAKEAIVLQWAVRTASWPFRPLKKWWAGGTAQWKMLCKNYWERVMQIWTCPSEEEEERKKNIWLSGDFLLRYFRDAFLAPLGVLFVMKTLEDER